jgi:hypothetical protein
MLLRCLFTAAVALGLAALPASADEFTEVIDAALSAYEDGDVSVAIEELDYALKLLREQKAAGLADLLPEARPGWTRTLDEDLSGQGGAAMAMFGGGTAAAATYAGPGGELTLTLMADSPMISGMAAMFSGVSSMGGGRTIRIRREQFGVTDGEVQGVVDGRVLVSVTGDASLEDKQAYIESLDFEAIEDF